jgi:hypothetical protein
MQLIYRKELSNFQTKFLSNIKTTLLKRMELGFMSKGHNNMLIDVLSEIDSRKPFNN